MDFRIELNIYRGPLDLLLYLVRKHEIQVEELPVAPITDQFLDYLEALQIIDVNAAGDFLDLASTLVEIKSRIVLPRPEESSDEEEIEDPRQDLVRRLLEYKRFKDAASMLEERGRSWQQRFPRLSNDLPPRRRDLAEEPIHELEIWDLVSAFSRVIRDNAVVKPASIIYDETPIQVYMARIHERLMARGRLPFTQMFESGMHKSALVGVFLAIMELVRRHGIHCAQDELFGEIWVYPSETGLGELDLSNVDNYDHAPTEDENPTD